MSPVQTPAARAALALIHSEEFCNLLAQARQYKAPGWWDGSAFRSHPCGLVIDTIKLTNHWHVDNLCTIEITDGAGWDAQGVCQDSFAHGSPHPQPIEGGSLTVWRCARWADPQYEEALKTRLLAILTAAAEHVAQAQEREQRATEAQRYAERQERQQMAAVALSKAAGSTTHG